MSQGADGTWEPPGSVRSWRREASHAWAQEDRLRGQGEAGLSPLNLASGSISTVGFLPKY